MEENKTVTEEEFNEELDNEDNVKDWLKSLNIDPLDISEELIAFIAEHAGIMGASAVIALLLRNQDLSGLKGFGKLCAGIGIVGLAGAAGTAAGGNLKKKVHNFFGFFKDIKKNKGINIKIGKEPETT